MRFQSICGTLAGLLLCASSHAQFYSAGDDPGWLHWSTFSTPNYKLIYPEGEDSLAFGYARRLEGNILKVSNSVGILPNGAYRKPLPVVLHSYTADANGLVTWAPRRMDLFTVMDPYKTEPLDWIETLSIHESRHVAQMQYYHCGSFRPWAVPFGEMAVGGLCALYGGTVLFEGDAVVTETGLSKAGRGRNADFLEYYRVAADEGVSRNWYRWRYGLQDSYSPNHYALGYVSLAGLRTLYDAPDFTQRYYDNVLSSKWPFPIATMRRTVEKTSGKKAMETFKDIKRQFAEDWAEDRGLRGPDFMEGSSVTDKTRLFRSYTGLTYGNGKLYAVRNGIDTAPELVRINDDGTSDHIAWYSQYASDLMWSEACNMLFWSMSIPDARWSLEKSSRVYGMDPESGRTVCLNDERRYYNPSPSPLDERISVTEYPVGGGSVVKVLDPRSGVALECRLSPEGLQITETAWDGEKLLAAGLSSEGFSIYDVRAGWLRLMEPQPVSIKQMRSTKGEGVYFVSDRNGVNELYLLKDGKLLQKSNTRNGSGDYAFDGKGRIWYSELSTAGRAIKEVTEEDLYNKEVSFNDIHHYAIADKLSAQEDSLALGNEEYAWNGEADVRPYSKLKHLAGLHSWAPVYVDIDDISDISMETVLQDTYPGAMLLLQNTLGTAEGRAGYSLRYVNGNFTNNVHLNLKYSGLYPVMEFKMNLADESSLLYRPRKAVWKDHTSYYTESCSTGLPSFDGSLTAYVPLDCSRGGWQRGVVPVVGLYFDNNYFNTGLVNVKVLDASGANKYFPVFDGMTEGKNYMYSQTEASVRAYCSLPVAESCFYPRLGIGGQVGFVSNPFLKDLFNPAVYAYMYGYVPGILSTHGIKLTAMAEYLLSRPYFPAGKMRMMPRGFAGYTSLTTPVQTLFTVDYALPVLPIGHQLLGNMFYIKNLEMVPHFDLMYVSGDGRGTLMSAGSEFLIKFSNFLGINFDTWLGVSWSFNSGSLIGDMDRNYCKLVFSMDLE